MAKNDRKEQLLRLIVANPKITDKELSQHIKVSQPTIARYRNELEEKGILSHLAVLNNGESGTHDFTARKQFIITFNQGVTRSSVTKVASVQLNTKLLIKHCQNTFIGDKDGYTTLMIVLASRKVGDLPEIINAEVIPVFKAALGEFCIKSIQDINIEEQVHLMHNYNAQTMKPWKTQDLFITELSLDE